MNDLPDDLSEAMDPIPDTPIQVAALPDEGPIVGRGATPLNPALVVGGFSVFAVALFLWLNAHRTQAAEISTVAPTPGASAALEAPPPIALPTSPQPAGPFSGLVAQVAYVPPAAALRSAQPLGPTGLAATAPALDVQQGWRSPSVVVDLGGAGDRQQLAQAGPLSGSSGEGAAGGTGAPAGGGGPKLNESEAFAQRVGGEQPEEARAVPMHNPGRMVPQGAVIPGVLETAINSDLPGYTRAVVSRDVLSFDGKSVLIPKGSRLVGQYKSAVALGQSRAFIVWTRVIRPDGVSVQIGSPGTDALGRGGLAGDVNRHFFRRFSGSILLSVLNAGVASIGSRPSTEISIGSPGAAAGLTNSLTQGDAIPPTIRVPQGVAIRIFVARDLDFSSVNDPS